MLVAGCQTGGQYDQVARELRMQEDELYALEDYLEQYQQLVCKYRTENAALKRQLAENGGAPRTIHGTRPAPAGPNIEVTPPSDGTVPQPDLQTPDVPPLEETTSDESSSNSPHDGSRHRVTLASAQGTDDESNAARAVAFEPADEALVASDVWLHGEVVANEAGGGPRMVVEVQPLNADGDAVEFAGALSLMLMAPNGDGGKDSVARWDYRPRDVQASADSSGESKTIRFHLELPSDSPAIDASELWVRLISRHGGKLLAHAAIDLQSASLFSSKSKMPPQQMDSEEPPIVAAVYDDAGPDHFLADEPIEESLEGDIPPVETEIFDGGWTIARPGQPGGLPEENDEAKSSWRASLEPPPTVSANSEAARPKPRVSRPRETTETREAAASPTPKRTAWSPERRALSAESARMAKARPSWSATR
ncbi:MAG: hypothetical protein L0228_01135 [Planctomycetes bacterium]|nr:hypothetical protein [Planctomycetota bacterium]